MHTPIEAKQHLPSFLQPPGRLGEPPAALPFRSKTYLQASTPRRRSRSFKKTPCALQQ